MLTLTIERRPRVAALRAGLVVAACLGWILAGPGGCKRAEEPPSAGGTTAKATPEPGQSKNAAAVAKPEVVARPDAAAPPSLKTANDVLQAMVSAYKKASSYADKGTLRIRATQGEQKMDEATDYSLVLVRPNKIFLQVLGGVMFCDGREVVAYAKDLPNQVAKRPAPATIDIKAVFADPEIGRAISEGPTQTFSWVPAPLLLMLADNPLTTIRFQSTEVALLEPERIGDHPCYRVQFVRPDGKLVLWIDLGTFVLRRIEFPTDDLVRSLGRPGADSKLENVSLVADFQDAALNADIDEKAFQYEIPASAQVVEWLMPPPLLFLGKPAPEFTFTGTDNKPIESKSIAGKIAVIEFWATWCGPCRVSLPILEKVYRKYKDNPKITFLAVSVDAAKTSDQEVKAMLDELNVTMPLARDPDQHAGKRFGVQGIPSTCIVGANRLVQDYQTGYKPSMETELSEKLDRLLAGQEVYRDQLNQFENQRKQYMGWLDKWVQKGLYVGSAMEEQEIPEAKIAGRSEPKALRLEPLWKCTELKSPGNLLVVPASGGPPKLFALDSWKTVAEIGPDGKLTATHPLGLPEREAATLLRTGAGADGKRYYAVSGIMQQQVHLFDENWKKLLSFPEDALKNPHAGIADVELADLDGDGKLEMLVSYYGVVGVQSVGLEGKRIWSYRNLSMVSRIAVWAPDPKGPLALLCTSELGSLVALDSQGKRLGEEIKIPKRLVHWIVTADLAGDGKTELCGLSVAELGVSVAIGIDPKGAETWTYPLPKGVHRRPVEQIVPGNLAPSGPGQWLLPGPDGSIHVIGMDGKLVDRWNTGSDIAGLATMTLEREPVVVVASPNAVEAWRVKWPRSPK